MHRDVDSARDVFLILEESGYQCRGVSCLWKIPPLYESQLYLSKVFLVYDCTFMI